MFVRQLAAFLALPFVAAIVIPVLIARSSHVTFIESAGVGSVAAITLGAVLLVLGVFLFSWSLYNFWRRGRGTLAPWDPPRNFVVTGPYRYVRNPMITGVICCLSGEGLVLQSRAHATWAVTFTLINAIYIPLIEEPVLAARFGEPYRRYTRHVGRFVPRLQPYKDDQ